VNPLPFAKNKKGFPSFGIHSAHVTQQGVCELKNRVMFLKEYFLKNG